MAMDVVRQIYPHIKHAAKDGSKIKLDLFLYSNGGDGVVPWRLVSLIREFSSEFNVIVPFNAFSAATLTALGADNIIMHEMGMLGPTDPSTTTLYNPVDPLTKNRIPISVEDVLAYRDLIREDFLGMKPEEKPDEATMLDAIRLLSADNERIHPLALGAVKRSHSQAKMLAKKLLSMHMPPEKKPEIEKIIEELTSKLFFHGHPINRNEAKQLNLKVMNCGTESDDIWELYCLYEKELKILEPFNPVAEFYDKTPNFVANPTSITKGKVELKDIKLAFIESEFGSNCAETGFVIEGIKGIDQTGKIFESFNVSQTKGGWKYVAPPAGV